MDQTSENHMPREELPINRKPYFGSRIRQLRYSFGERTRSAPGAPALKMRPSVETLITCMRDAGYQMSAAAYHEVEQGYNIPRDAGAFLDAVSQCLRLTWEEKEDLKRRLAYAILYSRLGDRASEFVEVEASWTEENGHE